MKCDYCTEELITPPIMSKEIWQAWKKRTISVCARYWCPHCNRKFSLLNYNDYVVWTRKANKQYRRKSWK